MFRLSVLAGAELADGKVREKARIDLTVPLAVSSIAPKGE